MREAVAHQEQRMAEAKSQAEAIRITHSQLQAQNAKEFAAS